MTLGTVGPSVGGTVHLVFVPPVALVPLCSVHLEHANFTEVATVYRNALNKSLSVPDC